MKRSAMRRTGRIKPVNRKRRAKKYARNFGDEAEAVRAMRCVADLAWTYCHGPVQAAHVVARGMGGSKGGRFDLVPLCARHHDAAGEAETSDRARFEAVTGRSLRAEADRIATPGIAALARRWSTPIGGHVDLDDYETTALAGWVRRRMQLQREGCREAGVLWTMEGAVDSVAVALGLYAEESPAGDVVGAMSFAVAICELAGWPS